MAERRDNNSQNTNTVYPEEAGVCFTCVTVAHLVSHNHRGASVDPQDWKLRLHGEEVKDLGNGLLIGAIGKHKAMETSA